MIRKILIVFLFCFTAFSNDYARISNKILLEYGEIKKVEILNIRDNIIVSDFIYIYNNYALNFRMTSFKENDIPKILMNYPEYQALLYYSIKIIKDNLIINESKIYIEKDKIFSLINEKAIFGENFISYLLNLEKEKEYLILLCYFLSEPEFMPLFNFYNKINYCKDYGKIIIENEILPCDPTEELLGYDCDIWKNAKKKRQKFILCEKLYNRQKRLKNASNIKCK